MNYNTIEKDWITKAGLRAFVLLQQLDKSPYRCGYVGIPKSHGLFEVNYAEIEKDFSVHGGITFSGYLTSLNNDLYWFGFDCAHSNDKSHWNPNGIERTLEYCVEECESLAQQIEDSIAQWYYYALKTGRKLPEDLHNKMLAAGIDGSNKEYVEKYIELIQIFN